MANSLISQTIKSVLRGGGRRPIPVGTVAINGNRIKTIDAYATDDSKVFYKLRLTSGMPEAPAIVVVDDAPSVLQPKIAASFNKSIPWTDTEFGAIRYFPVADIIFAVANSVDSSTKTDIWMEVGSKLVKRTVTQPIAEVIANTADPSSDAMLSNLMVTGTTVSGFVFTKGTYSVVLPNGTVAVPTVTATVHATGATAVVTAAGALPGNTTVAVTAQDGVSTKTYTISFTVAAS